MPIKILSIRLYPNIDFKIKIKIIKKINNLIFFCFENGDKNSKNIDRQAKGIRKINKGLLILDIKKDSNVFRKDIIISLSLTFIITLCTGSPKIAPITKCILDNINENKITEKTCRYIFKFLFLFFRRNDKGIKNKKPKK